MTKNTGLKHKCGTLLDRDNVAGDVFILPFIIGLVVFTAIPFFTSLYLAFTKYNVLSDPKWVGLANFKEMFFEDELFWTSFKVTFKFALIQVPVKLTVALLVAMVLARATRVTSFYRAAFYIPSLMGGSVAIALLWKQLFSPKGVINQILGFFGLPDDTAWLGNPKTALGTLIALGVWQFGSSMLIFLAAIKNIPSSYYEAAIVDGASIVKRIWHVDIPGVLPTFCILLIMRCGSIMNVDFEKILLLQNDLNGKVSEVISTYVYKQSFQNTFPQYSYSASIGLFTSLVNMALLVTVNPADFPYEGVLGGMRWQREIEGNAYRVSGSYRAPAQKVGDFLAGRPSVGAGRVTPTYRPGVTWCDLHDVLPGKITDAIAQALPRLDGKLKGFADPDAVMTAPETRSSSPVRIIRDSSRQSSLRGLYPTGEGAGYAGGIMSAAIDGIMTAETIIMEENYERETDQQMAP